MPSDGPSEFPGTFHARTGTLRCAGPRPIPQPAFGPPVAATGGPAVSGRVSGLARIPIIASHAASGSRTSLIWPASSAKKSWCPWVARTKRRRLPRPAPPVPGFRRHVDPVLGEEFPVHRERVFPVRHPAGDEKVIPVRQQVARDVLDEPLGRGRLGAVVVVGHLPLRPEDGVASVDATPEAVVPGNPNPPKWRACPEAVAQTKGASFQVAAAQFMGVPLRRTFLQ